jgi:hypothetical protein
MASTLKWDTRNWDKIRERCVAMKGLEVVIGVQGDAAAAQHGEGGGLTNAEIAAVHEFSGPQDRPPGRPFIRPIYDSDPEKWQGEVRQACVEVIKGANAKGELRKIGERYRNAIIDRGKAGIAPPLAESTINRRKGQNTAARRERIKAKERKGGRGLDATPLIDTGALIGAISVVVQKG